MAQELLHEKKQLTFEQICKKWGVILDVNKLDSQLIKAYVSDPQLDIGDPRFCVVGEAHGFNDDYFKWNNDGGCRECCGYSQAFYNNILDIDTTQGLKIGFTNHWNQRHI